MHLRLTIVVSRTHWQCLICRVAKQHSVSIDEHLKTEHCDLLFPKEKGTAPYNSYLSYSDGEVDYMHYCAEGDSDQEVDYLHDFNEDNSDGEVDYMHDYGDDQKSTCTADVPEDVPCAEDVHQPRKRGRPRRSVEIQKSTSTADVPEDVPCAEDVHQPRKRGRPKGSKNKIKPTGPNIRKGRGSIRTESGSADGENRVTDLQSDSAVSEQLHNMCSTSGTQSISRLIYKGHDDHVSSKVSLEMDKNSSKTNPKQAEAAFSFSSRKSKQQSRNVFSDESEDNDNEDVDYNPSEDTDCDDSEDIDCDESEDADFEYPASVKKSRKRSKSTVTQTQFKDQESVSTTKSVLKGKKPKRRAKPVERNLEIADKEKEKLQNCYVHVQLKKRPGKVLNCSRVVEKSLRKSSRTKKSNESDNSLHILPEDPDVCKELGAANSANSSLLNFDMGSLNVDKFDQSSDKKDISNLAVVGNVPNFQSVITDQNTIKVENICKDEPSACEPVSVGNECEMRDSGQNRSESIDAQTSQKEQTACENKSSLMIVQEDAQRPCLVGVPDATVVGNVDDTPASQQGENTSPEILHPTVVSLLQSGQMQSSSHSPQGLSQQDLRGSGNVTGYAQTSGGQQSTQSDAIQTGKNEVSESGEWIISRTAFRSKHMKPTLSITQPEQIFECTKCEGKFSIAEDLSNHVSQMSSHSESECKKCFRLFHSVYRLNLHVFGDHERRKKPFCFECGEKFQTMEVLERHLHLHEFDQEPQLLGMEFHECQICHKDVVSRHASLQKHYYEKHKRNVCLECFVQSKLTLTGKHELMKGHKNTHADFCNMCFQDFPSTIALEAHYKQHSNDKLQEDGSGQVCYRCDQWCPNRAFFLFHTKEHKLELMRSWQRKMNQDLACQFCDKVLRNEGNLRRHIERAHSSSRTYKFHCEFCGKGMDVEADLQDHIDLHHLGIRRYSCQLCSQCFNKRSTLRHHILKHHSKVERYTCQICNKKFFDKSSMDRHMYAHTGGPARFVCDQCGKGFYSSSDLKSHIASVHVEKLFSCHACCKRYKSKQQLKRHLVKCAKAANMDT